MRARYYESTYTAVSSINFIFVIVAILIIGMLYLLFINKLSI
jgi:hypothetical protein